MLGLFYTKWYIKDTKHNDTFSIVDWFKLGMCLKLLHIFMSAQSVITFKINKSWKYEDSFLLRAYFTFFSNKEAASAEDIQHSV